MIFFSLIQTAASCVFYATIVTAAIMTFLFLLLKSSCKNVTQTPAFLIGNIVVAVLLLIQSTLMIGAMEAKDATESARLYLNQLLENTCGTVSAQDSQQILEAVTAEYPIIGTYIGMADFSGHDLSELSASMSETISDYLRSYIWHRVWWMVGIIALGCMLTLLYEKNYVVRSAPSRHTTTSSRKRYDDF